MSSHSETTKPLTERPFSKDELANDVLWNTLGFSKDAVDRVRATLAARDERIQALRTQAVSYLDGWAASIRHATSHHGCSGGVPGEDRYAWIEKERALLTEEPVPTESATP